MCIKSLKHRHPLLWRKVRCLTVIGNRDNKSGITTSNEASKCQAGTISSGSRMDGYRLDHRHQEYFIGWMFGFWNPTLKEGSRKEARWVGGLKVIIFIGTTIRTLFPHSFYLKNSFKKHHAENQDVSLAKSAAWCYYCVWASFLWAAFSFLTLI